MATQPASATTTILFTDLVSSTPLLQRAGDEHAQRMFQAHHRMLREAVTRHGGDEVQWLGDGLMAAFPSALEAVRCAVDMQQESRRPASGERLHIRIGLHLGEALRDDHNYFGSTVVVARRLCDSGSAGEIRASDIVMRLLAGRGECEFENLGALDLKGITEPVAAWRVAYHHDPLALLTHTPFVGRAAESAALRRHLDAIRAGKGSVAVVVGEPGIGKTRMLTEFCAHARNQGARVLWGRCYDGDWAPPFSPFAEAIKQYAEETGPNEVRPTLGTNAAVLARIAPALHELLGDMPEPPVLPPEGERYRLLEAVSAFITGLAADQVLVLVLDDLHWADQGTVAMLRHVARAAASRKLLILGAYRDVEVNREHPLAAALPDLRRETTFERIALTGLASEAIGELLDVIAEHAPPQPLIDVLTVETNGNPFFIREVLLHLAEAGKILQDTGNWSADLSVADMGIPEGVREVIRRRLSRLSDVCNRMLTGVSALTGGFSFPELLAISEEPEQALLDALDESLSAQVLIETSSGTYNFTHALIRHTLYDALNTPRRVVLHRRIGTGLELLYAAEREPHLAELAHHFFEAAPGGDVEKAIGYCERAAEARIRVAAYEDAARLLRRAADLPASSNPLRRARLLERFADVMFMSGIDWIRGKEVLEEAIQLYDAGGDTQRLAQAHSRLGRALSSMLPETRDIPRAVYHHETARRLMAGSEATPAFGYVEVGLSNASLFAVDTNAGLESSQRAMEIAERIGHEILWANAATLHGFHAVNRGDPGRGIEFIEKAWTVADQHNHGATAFVAAWQLGHVLTHLVIDPPAARAVVERELGRDRVAGAPLLRNLLNGVLVEVHLLAGDVASARAIDGAIGGQGQQFLPIASYGGHAGESDAALSHWLSFSAERGVGWHLWMYSDLLAEIYALEGRREDAIELAKRALAVAVGGAHAAAELRVRARLALLLVPDGDDTAVAEHVRRCEEIVDDNTAWRASRAYVDVARAALFGVRNDSAAATEHLNRAAAIFDAAGAPMIARRLFGGTAAQTDPRG